MPRKALKGLSDIKVFEILTNTASSYSVSSTAISIPYAQTLTRDIQSSSDKTYADDDIYDDEEIIESENMELTIPEADLDKFPVLEGGVYDSTSHEYSWGGNEGKEYAMTFKAKKKDGTYRMFRYYRVKFKSVKQDLATDDKGTNISVLKIAIEAYRRAYCNEGENNPRIRTYLDTAAATQASDLAWLDTVPSVPAASNNNNN